MYAGQFLKTAEAIFEQRGADYGSNTDTFNRISVLATTLLQKPLTPYDIAMVLHCVKLARTVTKRGHHDSYVDGINYLAFAGQLAEEYPQRQTSAVLRSVTPEVHLEPIKTVDFEVPKVDDLDDLERNLREVAENAVTKPVE